MSREAMEMAVEMLTQLIACHGEPRECAAIEAAEECIQKLKAAIAQQPQSAQLPATNGGCRPLPDGYQFSSGMPVLITTGLAIRNCSAIKATN